MTSRETSAWPVILPPGNRSIVPFDGERIVAGATRATGPVFDDRVTATGLAEVLPPAPDSAPGLAGATVWAIAGPIFGSVMTCDFGSKRNNAG